MMKQFLRIVTSAAVALASLALTMPEAAANSCTVQTTRVGDRTVITYTTGNGATCFQTFIAPAHVNHISVLVVGGGGGGGFDAGGGGGGGGQGYATRLNVTTNTTYNITVGGGGAAGTNSNRTGETGTSSAFTLPGTTQLVGLGGIGGGGCLWNGTSCQARNGGGTGGGTTTGTFTMTSTTGSTSGGNGGNGYYYSVSGSPPTPSARTLGTAGTARDMGNGGVTYGSGGDGGPGTGVSSTPVANSGGGGGGGTSNSAGSAGAHGIVIISYVVATCSPTQTLNSSQQTTLIFTTVGQCTYEVPSGVTSLAVEVVGGGGGGGFDSGGGGGGGGYGYSASVSVSAGETITMLVGVGGGGGISSRKIGISGGTSSFKNISATGGAGGNGCTFNGTNCNLSNGGGVGGSSSGATSNTSGKDGGNGFCYTSGANACGVAPATAGQVGATGVLDTATVYGGSGAGNGDVAGLVGTGQGGGGGVADGVGGIGRTGGSGRVVIRFTTAICSPTSYSSSDGTRQIYRFTSTIDCYWTVPAQATSANILIVGGGGGGGANAGGGGGGGGVILRNSFALTPGRNILIHVGRGGSGGKLGQIPNDSDVDFSGLNGEQSIFGNLTAPGGGGGGGKQAGGLNGASGGGSGHGASPYAAGGSGTFIADVPSPPAGAFAGATADNSSRGTGGGGATAVGLGGANGGSGGAGFRTNISDTATTYGGGGGGGAHSSSTASSGGCGSGGAGGTNAANAQDGATNTGCGGGGMGLFTTYPRSGNGADGVIFVSVLKATQSLVAANQPTNQSWNASVASDSRFGTAMRAVSSAGETVTATSTTASICTVDASGLLTKITPGTCTLNYSHPGNSTYQPWSYNYSFTITKATPTFAMWTLSSQNYGASFLFETPTLTSSSPGTFAYTSANTSIVSFNAGTSRWTANAVGSTTITANYTPANTTLWETSTFSATITISKSARTISFATTTLSKTYGDATFSVSASPSLGSGDGSITYAASGGGCSVNSSGLVTILTAGSCTINASISAGTNFDSATSTTPTTISIARKTLTISGTSIAPKVYDGNRNPGAVIAGTLSGLVAGESLTVSASASQLISANADTYTVTVTYTLGNGTGGLANNYQVADQSVTSVVTKKTLTVTASNASVAYGDNAPSITSTITGFIASENSTYLTTQPTCTTAYTSTSNVGSSPSTSCSGADATNYSFTYASGSVSISAVNLTVTASSHSISYGASVPTVTATITGFKNSQTSSVLSTQPSCTTTYTNVSAAGSYPTSCSGATATNYTFTYVGGNITVGKIARTVSLSVDTTTMIYGETTTATFSMSGSQLDGTLTLTVVSGSCSITSPTIRATAGTGNCVIRASATNAVSYENASSEITINLLPKALTITGTTIASRIYNGSANRGAITVGTVSGYVGSDSLNISAAALNYPSANVGSYTVSVQYTLISTASGISTNYSLGNQSVTGSITAAVLTVTAPSLSRHYSQALPTLNPSIIGFVGSETAAVLSVIPLCSSTYTITSAVGSSQSTSCSGGIATNYTFTYVNGIVTVTPLVRVLELASNKNTLVYGESTSITATPSIGVSDGTLALSLSGGGCRFGVDSQTVVAIDPTGTCTVSASITGGVNYNDATATPISIIITKKTLTISGASATSKIYDGSVIAPTTGGNLVGVINSDSITVTVIARFIDKGIGTNKPVTSISTISGIAASKYQLIQPVFNNESITAASLTVSGLRADNKPANGTRNATISGTPVLNGVVGSDLVSLINFSTGLFDTSTAGDSITVRTNMSLNGADANNYVLIAPNFIANILMSFDNTITFGALTNVPIGTSAITLAANATSGLSISFTLTGSACTISGTTLSFVGLGSCSITASQAGNQSSGGTFPAATPVTRTFSVTARPITITSEDKTYNIGGSASFTFKVSGGLLPGHRISSVSFSFAGSGLASTSTIPTLAGTYSITPSAAAFNNQGNSSFYLITYTAGTLVILGSTPKQLASLRVNTTAGGSGDLLNSGFSNAVDSYTVRVDYSISGAVIALSRASNNNVNVQVRINDSGWRTLRFSTVTGGSTDSGVLPLPTAQNIILIRLYGADKELDTESRIISIYIYRDQPSRTVVNPSDTTTVTPTFQTRVQETTIPAAASISAIVFTPAVNFGLFNPTTTSYTANVAKRISAIAVLTSFTGNGVTVRISVNGGPQKAIPASGQSDTYALAIGSNTLVVRVTSPDSSSQQYLFTITRAAS